MGSHSPVAALMSVFSRTFTGGVQPAYHYLEFFPQHHAYLMGKSFPNPMGLLPFEPYRLTVEVMNWRFPGLESAGVVGSMPTVFWGELYANFGVTGVVVFPFFVGIGLFVIAYLSDRLENTPLKVGLLVWLVLHYKDLAVTGLSGFMFDFYLFGVVGVVLVVMFLSNNLKIKNKILNMFVPFVVKKYFFSKKIRNIINLISGISILSVTIGTASLIIILSVFNGIDSLVQNLMNSFDPDLKVEIKYGKNFPQENIQHQLTKIEGIQDFSFVLEDNALLQYGNRKFVGTVLGIDNHFTSVSGIDTMLLDGKFELKNEVDSIYIPQAIVGGGVAYRLSIAINSMRPLQIWIPRAGQKFSLNPTDLFNKSNITPVGVFSVQQDYDIKYVLVPYKFAQNLLEKEHLASAVFVKVKPNYAISDVQNTIISTLGNNYKVSDRFQQHATLYKMMKSEKKMIFIIFIFVLLIASFSGIGSVTSYSEMSITLTTGEKRKQDKFIRQLTDLQYERNDTDFHRGTFRVRGDVVDVYPAGEEVASRLEFFGDQLERITKIDPLTGEIMSSPKLLTIYPNSHYVTPKQKLDMALVGIKKELDERLKYFKKEDKLLEFQRLEQRTNFDLEMLEETGFVKGIENYSRYITDRVPGEQPATLLDYFPDDYLMFIDESHMTIPQIRGMYNGDRARKEVLVEHGFRLPSALDNRPLNFTEFEKHVNKLIYVSATPAEYELSRSPEPTEQIIRPTGLLDPEIEVRKTEGQVDDLIAEIRSTVEKRQRVLVTTLTKRMSEDLTDYLKDMGIKVQYLHSDVDTLERSDILRDLRMGVYDVLVGINLLAGFTRQCRADARTFHENHHGDEQC